jgi:hypothetical protein
LAENINISVGLYDIQAAWSPDHQWLALNFNGIQHLNAYAIGVQADHPVIRLSEGISAQGIPTLGLRWLPTGDEVVFARNLNGAVILYAAHVPDGERREIGQVRATTEPIDMAWSPDGWWVALSYPRWDTAPSHLYVVGLRPDAETFEVMTSLPDESAICVGWFEPEITYSGEPFLCDTEPFVYRDAMG